MSVKISSAIHELTSLGLSPLESKIFLILNQEGSLSAEEIAKILNVSPNSLYRSLNSLLSKNLISSNQSWPNVYRLIPPVVSFESLAQNQINSLKQSKDKLINLLSSQSQPNDQTKIEIIGGKKELFRYYVQQSKKANSEILIISIGEEVSEDVLLVNRDCLERGVKISFITHRLDSSNKDYLIRWQRMGIQVRYLLGKGYHLVVFDRNFSLLSASNPNNPKERTTIQIYSSAISQAFGQYFDTLWEKSTPIV